MRLVHIAAPLGALALLSGCQLGEVRDAGPETTRSFPAGNATKLILAGSYDVTVSTGSAPGVQATGGQNRLQELVVEQEGDTLKIHPRETEGGAIRWNNDKGVKISVTLPALSNLTMAGAGDVTVNKTSAQSFGAVLAGAGNLTLEDLQAQQVELRVAGTGDIKARGAVGNTKIALAGTGDINAGDLVTQTADVSVVGTGDVRLQAKQSASVSIAGTGDVTITGGAKCNISKAGTGDVSCS